MRKYHKAAVILLTIFSSCAVAPKKMHDENIQDKYWKLISLNGEAIPINEVQQKVAHMILKEGDSTLIGNTGCNSMNGKFSIGTNNSIKFSRIITTKMACMDVDYERDFLDALENSDQFRVNNDTLILLDNAQTILAKLKVSKQN